jgi:hypothetical protein
MRRDQDRYGWTFPRELVPIASATVRPLLGSVIPRRLPGRRLGPILPDGTAAYIPSLSSRLFCSKLT